MGGKTFPAVQFLDTFHDHIKPITKTKPRTPSAFPLKKPRGRTKEEPPGQPEGGGGGSGGLGSLGLTLGLPDLQREERGLVCFPSCTAKIFIHSASTTGYSLHARHCSRAGDTAVTQMDEASRFFLVGAEVEHRE